MLRLHSSPDSASMAVRMILEELGLPHEVRVLDRTGGALQSPDYRALHPLGLIPALDTPDGTMFETAAILLWLADRAPQSGLAPAPDSAGRADFLKWLFFTSTNLHPHLLNLFYPDRAAGAANEQAVIAASRDRISTLLAAVEAAAARKPQWLSAEQPTVLGYYLSMLLRWLGSFAADDPRRVNLPDYPALHAVAAYLDTRPAAQSVAAAEGLGPRPFTEPA
ncbi:glutathione S-transferase family protein [Fuscibacter oryzae]|uniref:Glutathione S-transferase family protein n=1 Tax=Fuscibacter oryzae TaxID=2803939 RepID=A0A8J7MM83_9RHOB|nr:glutathione S-transferase family protein [Fuscibacter oryzae]MBL4927405.1 glutathione S-transferase family protein [Fuscibacter oryzae]